MIVRNLLLLLVSGTVLSGCFESEESCYERLKKDFAMSVDAQIKILLIYMDDDQNACDFISDGPRLRRK